MSFSVLNFGQKYTLSEAQFKPHKINPHKGTSELAVYADSCFGVLVHRNYDSTEMEALCGERHYTHTDYTVQRMMKADALPPLGKRVEWPEDKIGSLKIDVYTGRSGNPDIARYHFDVTCRFTKTDRIYTVLMTEK